MRCKYKFTSLAFDYVKLTSEEQVKHAVLQRCAQTICIDGFDLNCDAIAVGMGCGVSRENYLLISKLLTSYNGTLIIDADGLNALAKFGADALKSKTCKLILTCLTCSSEVSFT